MEKKQNVRRFTGWSQKVIALGIIVMLSVSAMPELGWAAATPKSIILKIDHSGMFVDDAEYSTLIDPSTYAAPTVIDNRVYLPVSNIIREFGGSVQWAASEKKITINLDKNKVVMYLNRRVGFVNGSKVTFDAAPKTIDGRTMVPLRVVSENLGLKLVWDKNNQVIALYHGKFSSIPSDYSEYFIPVGDENDKPSAPSDNGSPSNNKPIDQNGKAVRAGDRVSVGFFYGEVKQVSGGRILVYWDSKNELFISDEDVSFWALASGVRYKASSWIDADQVTVER
ncbi:stalk domain-containing protein [Saccharibacillus sacchari]|uniref:stalk domain-containing protein n=1 Tax=Saccharibacillus sacchari TaxID=456493 RepID=UPI0004AC8D24|nr:stalk domain-containing protein [Saccharibacillus sacchari]